MKRIFTFMVLMVMFGFAHSAQANLITNGDFESCSTGTTGLHCGWNFGGAHTWVDAGIGNPGQGVRLESNGSVVSDPWMSQTVGGLSIGTSYDLSWDIQMRFDWGGQSANGPSFGIFLDNQVVGNALYLGEWLSTSYTSLSTSFTATSTSHTFIFAGELDGRSNGAGKTDVSYNIDNIGMLQSGAAPIPEPGTMLLLSSGLVGLAVFRKKFKVKTS